MKKRNIIILFCLYICLPTIGQKLNDVLQQADALAPDMAMYYLRDMQQLFTDEPKIYAKLGDLSYQLSTAKDPLRDYQERKRLLYSARLYYGNCLHFATDKSQYAALPQRIQNIKQQEQETDSIYIRFNRLVNDYNECVVLFTRIMNQHTQEKMAHLLFAMQDSLLLDSLRTLSATIPQRIEAYQEVQNSRTAHFVWLPIDLYRLDGLTYSNFLETDIALWDYHNWIQQFITTHRDIYEQLYHDMQTDNISNRLLNQLQQIDYESAIYDWFIVRQQAQTMQRAWQNIAAMDSIDSNETLMHLLVQAHEQQIQIQQAHHMLQLHRQKMNNNTFMRYMPFFRSMHITEAEQVVQLAETDYEQADKLQKQFNAQLLQLGTAYMQHKTESQLSEEGFLAPNYTCIVAMPISATEFATLIEQNGEGIVSVHAISTLKPAE
ncbi:MAG: hypothetical protein ACI392_04645 [Paludibacteraceae bacterium]